MESPELLTQNTTIREADALLSIQPIIVSMDRDLQSVAVAAAEHPGARVVAVVDDDGKLVGMIPVRVLVNEIFFKIVPEEFLGQILDIDQVLDYAKHLGARTAADVMIEPVSVQLDATVRDAFEIMHRTDLIGLPITDHQNHVVGYVDQLELLLVWVKASGTAALLARKPDEEPQ